MGYDFYGKGQSREKKEYGPGLNGRHLVTFKKHKPLTKNFAKGGATPGIAFYFMEPSSEKFCNTWARLPIKSGDRLANIFVALAGGEISEGVLKSNEKLNSFLDGCIGQQYWVNTEAKDTWSNILWDSKHRPLIEMVKSSAVGVEKVEENTAWKFETTSLEKDSLPGEDDDSQPLF